MTAIVPSAARAREVEELVLGAVADTGGLERAVLTARTPLLEANVDSLTLIAIIARLELALDVRFNDEESMQLVEARDVGELCEAVARKLVSTGESESR